MRVLSQLGQFISLFAAVTILTGCATTTEDHHHVLPKIDIQSPEVQAVKMLLNEQDLAHCEFKGNIEATSPVDEETGEPLPYAARLITTRNILRQKAYELGGNSVHIMRVYDPGRFGIGEQIITINGRSFLCQE